MNTLKSGKTLALLGGNPYFRERVPVGQLYFPDFPKYEQAIRDIFFRRYYTNQRQGAPLIKELESRLCRFFQVRNAICVVNATVGLIMIPNALGLSGEVLLPSWTFAATAQSLYWNRIKPHFCDIDLPSQQLSTNEVDRILSTGKGVNGILAVNLWGGAADVQKILTIANTCQVPLYFDSSQAFGCEIQHRPVGNFGHAEVFSFHATKILSTAEGGVITTNDDELADKLRAMIYYDYKNIKNIKIEKTFTARMSEMQAALALMSLDAFEERRSNNENQHTRYCQLIKEIPGLTIIHPSGVTRSNYQYLVLTVNRDQFGLTRDELWTVLRAENIWARRYFNPPLHAVPAFSRPANPEKLKNTIEAAQITLQLPLGARIGLEDIEKICEVLLLAQKQPERIKRAMS